MRIKSSQGLVDINFKIFKFFSPFEDNEKKKKLMTGLKVEASCSMSTHLFCIGPPIKLHCLYMK